MATNLLSILQQVRPKQALFTTYTLSLSYFEAAFVPMLRQVGCREIVILADPDAVAASIEESKSVGVGRSYRVRSVRAPGGGIFHPKLAYLRGDGEDVLVVASGNLTLPGQGGNLEVVDAVSANSDPGVFLELASFFDLLGSHEKQKSETFEILRSAKEGALRAYQRHSGQAANEPTCWLVHTLERSAASALLTIAKGVVDGAESLTVLSPFHSDDGGPMLRMAGALGGAALRIGLDRSSLRAPFERKRLKIDRRTTFVVPDLKGDRRPLHAKWIEIKSRKSVLLMTGSVNATHKSLETTQNVEVALARLVPKSAVTWISVTPKSYEPILFKAVVRSSQSTDLEAHLRLSGSLEGRFTDTTLKIPPLSVALLCDADTVFSVDDVRVDERGHFAFHVGPLGDLPYGLQIRVIARGLEAVAWVSIESDLSSTEDERKDARAIASVSAGAFGGADVARLLAMLARVAGMGDAPDPDKASDAKEIKKRPSRPPNERKFSWDQWRGSGRRSPSKTGAIVQTERLFGALARWINSDLNISTGSAPGDKAGKGPPRKKLPSREDTPDAGSEGLNSGERNQAMFIAIVQAIPSVLANDARHPDVASLVNLTLASALKRSLADLRTVGVPQGVASCIAWLSTYSRFDYSIDTREELASHFCALACLVAALFEAAQLPVPYSALKEALVTLFGQELNEEDCRTAAKEGLLGEVFARVSDPLRGHAIDAAGRIVNAQTLEQSVLSLIELGLSPIGKEVDPRLDALAPGVGNALRVFRASTKPFGVLRSLERAFCPCCFMQFNSDQTRQLSVMHAIVCKQGVCGRAVFLITSDDVLAKLPPGGRIAR